MKRFLLATLTLASSFLPLSLYAHSGAHPIRYIAPDGKDEGECGSPMKRCKTIFYTVNQSSKGDTIRVAQGDYEVSGDELLFLLSDIIEMKGGYSIKDNFKRQNADKNITTVIGIPSNYRERLLERGFHLNSDLKGKDIKSLQKDLAMLYAYEIL